MGRASRFLALALLGVLCTALLPVPVAAGESRTFPETGQTSSNAFYEFWLAHGQAAILGYPVSPTFRWRQTDDAPEIVVQFYERAVLEWHPENPPPERVQLRRLGDELLDLLQADRPGRRSGPLLRSFPPEPCDDAAGCVTFEGANHTLRGPFADYWRANGGLTAFGYPITEEFAVQEPIAAEPITVQYFERARMEYHTDGTTGFVQLGLLGVTFWNLHWDATLAHPELFVTVPESASTEPYLPASP